MSGDPGGECSGEGAHRGEGELEHLGNGADVQGAGKEQVI